MSTPIGPHSPINPKTFEQRVKLWHNLMQETEFYVEDYMVIMAKAQRGDVVYCDPPYTHSQSILYGSQEFRIEDLFQAIKACKDRGVYVILSINGMRESKKKNISIVPPEGLFEREIQIDCGFSMIDRLQNSGGNMANEQVHDRLLLTY